MDEKFEILMVSCNDGIRLVEAPAFRASVGRLVEFGSGHTGTIVDKAFCHNDDMERILRGMNPVYTAKKLYDLAWEAPKNTNGGTDNGNQESC